MAAAANLAIPSIAHAAAIMPHPAFFDLAPRIRVREPLAVFLGSHDSGIFEYSYLDAVKLAGHSCPTVAGAFLMVRAGLAALYSDDLPERGTVRALFPEPAESGVTGVMANVASLVTGGRAEDGFHGIGGRFGRNGLLDFAADIAGTMALEHSDRPGRVSVVYNPQVVPAAPKMRQLLQLCVVGAAGAEERREFGRLWQDRVKRIIVDHCDDPDLVRVTAG